MVGLIDITVRPMVEPDMQPFAVPYTMFRELEDNASGSFLEKKVWHKVVGRMSRGGR